MPSFYTKISRTKNKTQFDIALPAGIADVAHIIRKKKVRLLPQTYKRWIFEMLSAVQSLHKMELIHGDIKPGNMIIFPRYSYRKECGYDEVGTKTDKIANDLQSAIETSIYLSEQEIFTQDEKNLFLKVCSFYLEWTTLKLSDFGLSSYCCDAKAIEQSFCYTYTSSYRPPEVWRRNSWGFYSDIWALGCSFYEMYFGYVLFREKNQKLDKMGQNEIKRLNVQAHDYFSRNINLFLENPLAAVEHDDEVKEEQPPLFLSFSPKRWKDVSILQRPLIASMIQPSPSKRILTHRLIVHPFFNSSNASSSSSSTSSSSSFSNHPAESTQSVSSSSSNGTNNDKVVYVALSEVLEQILKIKDLPVIDLTMSICLNYLDVLLFKNEPRRFSSSRISSSGKGRSKNKSFCKVFPEYDNFVIFIISSAVIASKILKRNLTLRDMLLNINSTDEVSTRIITDTISKFKSVIMNEVGSSSGCGCCDFCGGGLKKTSNKKHKDRHLLFNHYEKDICERLKFDFVSSFPKNQ
jgi:serine/threonine protein kinase